MATAAIRKLKALEKKPQLFIGGKWVDPAHGESDHDRSHNHERERYEQSSIGGAWGLRRKGGVPLIEVLDAAI